MVFIIMAFGGVFALFWLITFAFAAKSQGDRSVGIPSFWLVFFGAISSFGVLKWTEANSNPEKIVTDKYFQMKEGMKYTEVQKILGVAPISLDGLDETELEQYDLTKNDISFPADITSRFSPGVYSSSRKESAVSFTIYGTESNAGEKNNTFKDEDGVKPLLGSSAVVDEKKKQGHGLKGLQLRIYVEDEKATEKLKEERKTLSAENAEKEDFELPLFEPIAVEGKEWIIEEGKDWEYIDGMKDYEAAKAIAEAISKNEHFEGVYEVDEDALKPTATVKIQPIGCTVDEPACPDDKMGLFAGVAGNDLQIQVKTGPNLAVHIGNMRQDQANEMTKGNSADAQKFFGGTDSAAMIFWYEEEPFIDDDFNTVPRLFIAAFVSKKLAAIGQNGLSGIDVPKPLESLATGDMEGTMQQIIKGCENTEYKKFTKKGFFSAEAMEKYKQAVKDECTPS